MLMLNSMHIFMHIVAFTIQFFIHFLFTCVFVYTPFHGAPLHSMRRLTIRLSDGAYKHLLDEHTVKRLVLTYAYFVLCVVLYRTYFADGIV